MTCESIEKLFQLFNDLAVRTVISGNDQFVPATQFRGKLLVNIQEKEQVLHERIDGSCVSLGSSHLIGKSLRNSTGQFCILLSVFIRGANDKAHPRRWNVTESPSGAAPCWVEFDAFK